MDNLTFESKVAMLALAKSPKERADIINKFSNGAQFFIAVNKRTMPLAQYMELNKEKFAIVAKRAAILRGNMKNKGWTDKKYQKFLAELPEDLLNDRPEFSAYLSRKQFKANIQRFLEMYPMFRVDK